MNKSTIKRLLIRLSVQRGRLIVIILSTILSCLTYAFMPIYSGQALDGLIIALKTKNTSSNITSLLIDTVLTPVIILLSLGIASTLLALLQQRIVASVGEELTLSFRKDINKKITKLPLSYFDSHSTGDILSRTTNDLEKVAEVMQTGFMQLIYSIFTILFTILIMLVVNPKLTLLVVFSACLSAGITGFTSTKSQKHFYENQKNIGNINSRIEEFYSGNSEIKVFNQQKQAISSVVELNEHQLKSGKKAEFFNYAIFPLIRFLNQLGFILTAVISGLMVIQGKLSVGLAQAFLQYMNQLSEPITQTSQIINSFQAAFAGARRVFEFLDEKEERISAPSNTFSASGNGEIKFQHVQFGYDKNRLLMKDISFEVKPNNKVAIVGPTGGGKTTLINLLMRFYEINNGSITLNGHDIQNLSREQLRKSISIVLQDIWLFEGSITENIAYGKPSASIEEVISVAKAARCHHFIKTLPDGYDTIISSETSILSQGQLQLITIARAMLVNPQVMILDEATSSVDTRTEVEIQKAMSTIMKNKTSFVIAHRLSTIKDADLILVVKDGDIIETGTHQTLIKQRGFYASLINSQYKSA